MHKSFEPLYIRADRYKGCECSKAVWLRGVKDGWGDQTERLEY